MGGFSKLGVPSEGFTRVFIGVYIYCLEFKIGFRDIWGFIGLRVSLENKGYFWRVPIIRSITFWGLYWGPPILGNYHIKI